MAESDRLFALARARYDDADDCDAAAREIERHAEGLAGLAAGADALHRPGTWEATAAVTSRARLDRVTAGLAGAEASCAWVVTQLRRRAAGHRAAAGDHTRAAWHALRREDEEAG